MPLAFSRISSSSLVFIRIISDFFRILSYLSNSLGFSQIHFHSFGFFVFSHIVSNYFGLSRTFGIISEFSHFSSESLGFTRIHFHSLVFFSDSLEIFSYSFGFFQILFRSPKFPWILSDSFESSLFVFVFSYIFRYLF